LKVFDNFLCDNVGIGKISAVFELFVFEPKGVELELESPGLDKCGK